tara:strand:- start:2078 stop:2335 length:258 start_codon:yes stop_codon:yes gene_type:complete
MADKVTLTDDTGGLSIDAHKRIKFPCNASARDAGVSHPLPGRRVGYAKSAERGRTQGRRATGIGVRDPRARLRPLRRLTPSFSSV